MNLFLYVQPFVRISSNNKIFWSNLAGEVMVCVLDFRREMGLWHGILSVSYMIQLIPHINQWMVCGNGTFVIHAFEHDSNLPFMVYILWGFCLYKFKLHSVPGL